MKILLRNRTAKTLSFLTLIVTAMCFSSCSSVSERALAWEGQLGPVPLDPVTPKGLVSSVNLKQTFIPAGRYGRKEKVSMKPTFITIHSTQNYTGDAHAHSLALARGKLKGGRRSGYLYWHYTVQEDVAIQHMPTNEAGEHADFEGPGNRYSIGIEMCEHRGNDLGCTIERTAQLTAWLMYQNGIPISNVVPHHHWPREGMKPEHKNCPHFLLDNGKPRATWKWFQMRVKAHYQRIQPEPGVAAQGTENFQNLQTSRTDIPYLNYGSMAQFRPGADGGIFPRVPKPATTSSPLPDSTRLTGSGKGTGPSPG